MKNVYAEVYVLEGEQHRLEIKIEEPIQSYRLYWTTSTNMHIKEDNCIASSNAKQLDFTMQVASDEVRYFIIVFEDGEKLMCGYRIVPIAGMYNVRDLGGYSGYEGKHIAWGKLYRGDNLCNMKETGKPYLKALQLRSIVDFRGPSECEQYPNNINDPNTKEYHYVPDGQIAAFAGSLQNNEKLHSHEAQIVVAREMVKTDPDYASKAMIAQQIEFVQNPASQEAYANMLKLMAKADSAPLFFHCKGGKDRTGYGAMLLLSLLGVDEETILYDYLLTNRAREKKNQRYLQNFRNMAQGDETVAQYLFSIFDTRGAYLQAAIDEIKKNYGTIENYVVKQLHISQEDIESLRKLYLV